MKQQNACTGNQAPPPLHGLHAAQSALRWWAQPEDPEHSAPEHPDCLVNMVQEGDAPGLWEETFKSHTDTKPRGPEAISMDLSFPGVEHLYGLPQHADSFNLQSTRGVAPCCICPGQDDLDARMPEFVQPAAGIHSRAGLRWAGAGICQLHDLANPASSEEGHS